MMPFTTGPAGHLVQLLHLDVDGGGGGIDSELGLNHPYPREKFRPQKSTKKRILRNFICHLDRHFLKFLAIFVGNQQRTDTTNPLQNIKV